MGQGNPLITAALPLGRALMSDEICSSCGMSTYPDSPKHLVSGDCITGYDADTDEKMTLCWGCYPLRWEMVRDGSGLNKFKRVD